MAADALRQLRPSRPRWPGVISAVLGLLTAGGLVAGLVLATSDLFEPAIWAAWGAIAVSVAAVVLGLICLIAGFGRGWAVIGIVLGVIANPLVLVHGLGLIGRLGA